MENKEYKKVTKAGGITIPAAVRRELGIETGDGIELEIREGNLSIKPYQLRCSICKTQDDVVSLEGKGICRSCATLAINKFKGSEE